MDKVKSTPAPKKTRTKKAVAPGTIPGAPLSPSAPPVAPRLTIEQRMADDFKFCLYVVWKMLGLPPPTVIQYEIADYLQYGPKRRMVQAFRGIGKSWVCSIFTLWYLRYKCRNHKFLIVSASKNRSDDFTSFTKKLIREIPFFKELKPREDQRDSAIAFDVNGASAAHAPSVKSAGIFGQITGSRADTIIVDDAEISNNSATLDLRDKLKKASTEFEAIIVPGGDIVFLGTPQSEESIYRDLPERGYDVRIWPARYPSPKKLSSYGTHLAPSIAKVVEEFPLLAGKPTDPLRFTEDDLMERELSYGRSGFQLQFMLDVTLSEAERHPLKLSDLIVVDTIGEKAPVSITWGSSKELQREDIQCPGFAGDRWFRPMWIDKEWAPFEGSVLAIDPSGRGADEMGYAVVKHIHGYLYVTQCAGLLGGYSEDNLEKLARIARDEKVNAVIIESNFGDGMFTQLLKPVMARFHKVSIEEVHHTRQKELRIIDTLEPIIQRHKLIFSKELIDSDAKDWGDEKGKHNSLFHQMTRLTKDRGSLKHDDRLDALAIAVAYWVDAMSRDEVIAALNYRESMLDRELENFMNHALGPKQNAATGWIN